MEENNYNGALQKPIHSGFTAASTAEEVIKGIDLTGKIAIVTGGYTGIGPALASAHQQRRNYVCAAAPEQPWNRIPVGNQLFGSFSANGKIMECTEKSGWRAGNQCIFNGTPVCAV